MRRILSIVLVVALVVSVGSANTQYNTWTIQKTGFSSGSNDRSVALAMRGGDVWPVIFSQEKTVGLYPTGWQVVATNQVGMYPRAASSSTGQIAAIGSTGSWSRSGVASGTSGWSNISADAINFDSQGRLWKAFKDGSVGYQDNTGWHPMSNLPMPMDDVAIDVASNGVVGVVGISQGRVYYYDYNPLNPGWNGGEKTISNYSIDYSISLAFDSLNRPHFIGIDDNGGSQSGIVYDYSPQLNRWSAQGIGPVQSPYLPLVAGEDGTVGTALVRNDGGNYRLYYVSKSLSAGWNSLALPLGGMNQPSGPDGFVSVGLAYDYENLPVIAYSAYDSLIGNSGIWLAYDPIVPEPLSLSLLLLGGLALLRKRS